MADIFRNPNLPDYFVAAPEVTRDSVPSSYVIEYEDAKVVHFPNLHLEIDHEFWARAATDNYPALKKFSVDLVLGQDEQEQRREHIGLLGDLGVDDALASQLCEQMHRLYDLALPAYRAIFGDYGFDRHQVVWRLNSIQAENMHVDTYGKEHKHHFARMFINLDDQPRIWQLSWTIKDMVKRAQSKIRPEDLAGLTRAESWVKLNRTFFGKSSRHWWDDQPRHIAFFQPGDVWIADSRQVAHQIFYGRRALSIDFTVPRERMLDRNVHYLAIADRFVDEILARDGAPR